MQDRTQAGLELNMNELLSDPVSMLRSTPEPQGTQMTHGRSDQAASRAGGNQEDNDQQGGIAEESVTQRTGAGTGDDPKQPSAEQEVGYQRT
ncbi:uncharacterized protein RHO25_013202 [Cercospora beticola]|nr:hypothetical protein RHO25_013202 [Cercospora beticola]